MKKFTRTSGDLKHRITLLKPTKPAGDGWTETEYEPFVTVWAEIKTERDRRMYEADAIQYQQMKFIVIRYRKDVTRHMRIEHKGITYEIESLTNIDEMNKWHSIAVKEVI